MILKMKNTIHTLGNVFDDPEVDTEVDINEPRVTRSGRVFGIQ